MATKTKKTHSAQPVENWLRSLPADKKDERSAEYDEHMEGRLGWGDDCAFLREALNAILAVPVTSNSWDPDDMGKALDYIETVAMAALAGQPLPEPMSEPAQDDEANHGEGDRE